MREALAAWQRALTRAVSEAMEGDVPRLVFGDGNPDSPLLMLVGEAPGEQEAREGKPFVGKAGKNLNAFLATVGIARDALYVSNVVKFRPSRVSKAGRTVNRPPTSAEISLFVPWLHREVALIRPRAIVTLGNVALNAFIPGGAVIGELHGQWQSVPIYHEAQSTLVLPLFALYHPAAVIYNRALGEVYQADLEQLTKTLALSSKLSDN
ncbi:MAG: uracil-DNA glycosylase [Candidatus Limiplasma sp.]|nr:uracil-DNA glycosylase [Candidatus Limiplasma sp.]MEA5144644.1 uracil-DNA glycosylase [Candidatus Limiplasma sp.]